MSKRSTLILAYAALCAISVVFLFPFYWAVMSSFKSNAGLDLNPPAYYPAEARRLTFTMPAAGHVFSAQGKSWFLLANSSDQLAGTTAPGGYYQRLDNGAPSQDIEWFAAGAVRPVKLPSSTISFQDEPVHAFNGKSMAIAGAIVRQNGASFDELDFVVPDGESSASNLSILKDVPHHEIRHLAIHWENYVEAWKGPEASFGEESTGFLLFMRNSFFIAILAVIGEVFMGSLVAYGFARMKFKGREGLFVLLLATMMIPSQVTFIPLFAIYKGLHWIDTFLPLIVPHFFGGAFNIFLIRQYMLTIPKELDEAAEIDGCGPLRTYWQVILPNCTAPLILVGLFTFMGCWGDVLGPLIYLDNPHYRTVPLGLAFFQSPYVDNRDIILAGAVMAMLPMAGLFLIFQRYILTGVATSGLGGR